MQIVPQATSLLRPVITLQPVTRMESQRQAQIVDVPVTSYQRVTVDEGAYQTVWVPKLTTKTVASTTIQKQVQYQDVPVHVVQQIPMQFSRTAAVPIIAVPSATASP